MNPGLLVEKCKRYLCARLPIRLFGTKYFVFSSVSDFLPLLDIQIDGKWASMVTGRQNWTIERRSSSRGISSILVADGVALVSFVDDEPSQEIVAVDLEDLGERWRDDSDLTRLFGNDIYAFKFSTYTVNICDIK